MKFMIGDLPVLFPYDRIYPGECILPLQDRALFFRLIAEQYSYMSDLKQTLDAGVSCSFWSSRELIIGSLCARDAFRYRQNGLAVVFDRIVHAGGLSI